MGWAFVSDEPNRCSAEQFLTNLRIPDATHPIEGSMMTAMHYAAYANNPEAVIGLIKLRADPDPLDEVGHNPLHLAALTDSPLAAAALLDAGAKIENDVVGASGFSAGPPLQAAGMFGSLNMISLLLARKADVEGRSLKHPSPLPRGKTPLHNAALFGHQ